MTAADLGFGTHPWKRNESVRRRNFELQLPGVSADGAGDGMLRARFDRRRVLKNLGHCRGADRRHLRDPNGARRQRSRLVEGNRAYPGETLEMRAALDQHAVTGG